ncbi:MAG: ABC transporter ATP-binding protein [Demequinaceae bacterium]|nr:ABC transporter ATP-binding protein [Demequinaceae bacterium]
MTENPVIQLSHLTKKYGDFTAVRDLSVDIPQGEIFGFLGPNGAGKTTTIRSVLDLIRPTEGSATILGLDTHEHSVALRRRVGYLPGELAIYPTLTGKEVLTYFANLRGGVDWAWVDQLAMRFEADLSRKVGALSSGNKQKVGLLQAFMSRPEVYLLDEPSTGLDPLMQQEFQALLREVTKEGATVFLSSHTLSEVERAADRVGFIREGDLIAVELMRELREKALHRVTMQFAKPVKASALAKVEGVREVTVDGVHVNVTYEGAMTPLLKAAAAHEVLSLASSSVDLDEIFLTFYRGESNGAQGERTLR